MFALSRRRNTSEVVVKPKISSSRDAYTVLHSLIGELPYEEFWMLLLNRANKIMITVKVSEGVISGTVVDPKVIFFTVIRLLLTSLSLILKEPMCLRLPHQILLQMFLCRKRSRIPLL